MSTGREERAERDKLATVIETAYDLNPGLASFELLAHAILAAGYRKPRQVTTVEELDALGFQAVILDSYGTPYVCERFQTDGKRAQWEQSGMGGLLESEDVIIHGPITVLHSPVVTL